MSRKITDAAISHFITNTPFSQANMKVTVEFATTHLYLHGNEIAKKDGHGNIMITNAGWQSNTTKERLNGLPGVSISQKNGSWYLNGNNWDGSWVKI